MAGCHRTGDDTDVDGYSLRPPFGQQPGISSMGRVLSRAICASKKAREKAGHAPVCAAYSVSVWVGCCCSWRRRGAAILHLSVTRDCRASNRCELHAGRSDPVLPATARCWAVSPRTKPFSADRLCTVVSGGLHSGGTRISPAIGHDPSGICVRAQGHRQYLPHAGSRARPHHTAGRQELPELNSDVKSRRKIARQIGDRSTRRNEGHDPRALSEETYLGETPMAWLGALKTIRQVARPDRHTQEVRHSRRAQGAVASERCASRGRA